jgi:hypothetical protein
MNLTILNQYGLQFYKMSNGFVGAKSSAPARTHIHRSNLSTICSRRPVVVCRYKCRLLADRTILNSARSQYRYPRATTNRSEQVVNRFESRM